MEQKKAASLELYVHIPFCIKKCDYCDFLSGPADDRSQEAYVHALLKEMDAVQIQAERPVTSIFVGGGTPSVLSPTLMGRIFEKLNRKFTIAPDAEITMEANPGTLSAKKLCAYKEMGINRLSLGLQSPDDRELKILGRIHNYQQFLESFSLAREAGFSNINVDLMCAIPGQTYQRWMENLTTVARLAPEHISAYSLIVEEGTPFARRPLDLPDEDTEYRMYEDTMPFLARYGYEQYEISNYAKTGKACRHNIGYWTRTDYLGLGLGAASLMGNRRFSNTRSMAEYLQNSCLPEKCRQDCETLTKEDAMAEFMFLGLRMTKGISKKDFRETFACSVESIYGSVLEKYKNMSLLMEKDGRIFLSREGIHVSNQIMADFLLM